MECSSHTGAICTVFQRRHAWVCLLIAFFLLYNPFVASAHGTRGLEVGHPPSHRATVGACELQHFTPTTGWDCFDAPDIASAEAPRSLPVPTVEILAVVPPISNTFQQFFGPGLWFRPPPAK